MLNQLINMELLEDRLGVQNKLMTTVKQNFHRQHTLHDSQSTMSTH